jgi:hypothetical protein
VSDETARLLDALRVTNERLRDERDAWQETARRIQRNTDYYAGLLDRMARHFGTEAYRSEDGVAHDSPLRGKIPDLVDRLKMERDEAVAALAESDKGRTDQLRIIVGLRDRLENMETLLCAAAPLAWAHGVNVDGAHEWEKQVKALIEAEAKVDGS